MLPELWLLTGARLTATTKFLIRSKDKVDGAYIYKAITGVKDFAKTFSTASSPG